MDRKVPQRLSKRLRQLREARGLTQAQLAEIARKSVETISNFERGRTLPGVLTLSQLANHLGESVKDFFDFDTPMVVAKGDLVAERARLLSKDDRRLIAEFIDFLAARRRRSQKRYSDH